MYEDNAKRVRLLAEWIWMNSWIVGGYTTTLPRFLFFLGHPLTRRYSLQGLENKAARVNACRGSSSVFNNFSRACLHITLIGLIWIICQHITSIHFGLGLTLVALNAITFLEIGESQARSQRCIKPAFDYYFQDTKGLGVADCEWVYANEDDFVSAL